MKYMQLILNRLHSHTCTLVHTGTHASYHTEEVFVYDIGAAFRSGHSLTQVQGSFFMQWDVTSWSHDALSHHIYCRNRETVLCCQLKPVLLERTL